MATMSVASQSISFFSSSIFFSSSTKNPKFCLALKCRGNGEALSLNPIRSQLSPPIPVLSFTGEKVGETFLDLKSAPPDTARSVVHRGIVTDQQNSRRGTASTLTRGEVRGGGKKPYQQKETGHARRGSQRTPLRPGGGVIFGPKPKDWSIKINRKEKKLALSTAILSAAVNAVIVDEFVGQFEKPKTKEFIAAMKRWGLDPKDKATFLFGGDDEVSENLILSSRNIRTLKMLTPRTLNLFDVLNADKLVFTRSAVEYLNRMYAVNIEGEEEEEESEGNVEESENGSSDAE
ncbi:large ribosomal subunit protein uL4c [Aristolochia californica]|uniref:large ribosomal subunit protein uL4c n=1 Tax=Aristolochia californica TaxID=171875 RepID=UPI0035D776CD